MVRIIDSDAINKRVFADITNTFQHSQKITGENTVQNLSGADDPKAAAMDNFNFNGIEFSKVKQLINYVQTHKKEFKFDRQLVMLSNDKKSQINYFTGGSNDGNVSKPAVVINNFKKNFIPPDCFDGRNSFIYPRIVLVTREQIPVQNGTTIEKWYHTIVVGSSPTYAEGAYYDKYAVGGGYLPSDNFLTLTNKDPKFFRQSMIKSAKMGLTEKRVMFDKNEFLKCWAASVDDSDGNNCIIIDKQKNKVILTASIDCSHKNWGFRRKSGDRDERLNNPVPCMSNLIISVYLDIFFMYWRDK